jgi:isopentenyl phosphate kinase
MNSLTIVKLGGSVITHKDSSPPSVNAEALVRIGKEISEFTKPLIVVLGGGAYGHQAAASYGFGDSRTSSRRLIQGIPLIRRNMSLLATEVERIFSSENMPSVVITPFASTIMNDGLVVEFSVDVFDQALNSGLLIITHGDVCLDKTRGASILSGDTIVVHLARELGAKSVFLGTNVDGIYRQDSSTGTSEIIPFIDSDNLDLVLSWVGPSEATDVTGGMGRKLKELLVLADSEIETVIFNLNVANRLAELLRGRDIPCTRIHL